MYLKSGNTLYVRHWRWWRDQALFSAVSEYNFARVCVTVSHIPQLMSDLCYSSAVIALTTAFPSRQSVTLRSRCYFRPNRRWKGDTKACW